MPIQTNPRTRRSWLMPAVLALPLTFVAAQAQAGGRVALVIGNSAYQTVSPLPNPVRDAKAVRAMLEEAKFDVVHEAEATAAGMRTSLDTFARKAADADEVVVYFAGHAVQMNGANHLLPVDLKVSYESDIARQSLSLDDILKRLDATRARAKIVILDACRDNPFAGNQRARGLAVALVDDPAAGTERAVASEAGLARVASKGGTFVAFSTSPGATAADGSGDHSPYTAAFLKFVRAPGLPVEQLFRQVRSTVDETTNGSQLPWETSSLTTAFSFFDASDAAVDPAPVADPAKIRPTEASLREETPLDAYRTAIVWDDPAIYRLFLAVHPDDAHALRIHRILAQRQEEVAWARIVRGGTVEDLRLFLALYPGSAHATEARTLVATAASRKGVRVAELCAIPQRAIVPPIPASRPVIASPRSKRIEIRTEIKEPPKPAKPMPKPVVRVREARPPVVATPTVRPVRTRLPPRIERDDDEDDIEVLPPRRVPVIVRPFRRDFEPDDPRRDPGRDWPRFREPRGEVGRGGAPSIRLGGFGDGRSSFGGSSSGFGRR